MRFSGRWRDYQQRVIDEIDHHLLDRRIHVVAAPGSGKTILGLEIVRRLGRPAVILSPTRTIRDQWPARLVPLFLAEPPGPGDVSCELEAPSAMTTSTYQALHALWAEEDGSRFATLLAALHAAGPVTLVLDEAHHLRREWWKALQALVDGLPEAHLVALTATPPYDAPLAEWARYEAMCGPIDFEIGIPELVRNGDLCPHQDHIAFSMPDEDCLDLLERRRGGLAQIVAELRADDEVLAALEGHPWVTDPLTHCEAILGAPEMLSAILVHLAGSGRKLPRAPLALLGVGEGEIQIPSPYWLQILLDGILFRFPESFAIEPARRKRLCATLEAYGLIEGGRVRLSENRRIFTAMAGSLAKLGSIAAIAAAEAGALGPELRMVVLSDHVRAGELPKIGAPDYKPAKLGVVPIFASLNRAAIECQRIGVLTGTLTILPRAAETPLRALAARKGIAEANLSLAPLSGCPDHAVLTASGEADRAVVQLVTELFAAGEITILVGTQALLGEGWDAPAINSLVLASNAAAFMLSNQMRGLAIRIDPARPGKVSNIWHLATVDTLDGETDRWRTRLEWGRLDDGSAPTSDLDLLHRRFRAFEGVANSASPLIESGIDRLGPFGSGGSAAANARTFALARDRAGTATRWQASLGNASPRARVREAASPNYAPVRLAWSDTLHWLGVAAVSAGVSAAGLELRHLTPAVEIGTGIAFLGGVAAVAALPKLLWALWLLFRNGSLESSLPQVGKAVLASLHEAGMVSYDEFEAAHFEVGRSLSGRCEMILHGVSRATERAVLEAVAEVLGPVGNPRYLLVRESWLGRLRRTDYHAVPAALGQRKEWAAHFHGQWQARVGSSDLVFTRTPAGRLTLLRARARSFAAGFQRVVDRRCAWR